MSKEKSSNKKLTDSQMVTLFKALGKEALTELLGKLDQVKLLDLHSAIGDKELYNLSKTSGAKEFSCKGLKIELTHTEHIAGLLRCQPSITSVSFTDTNMGPSGLTIMAYSLMKTNWQYLDLSNNDIEQTGSIKLAKALKQNKSLECLNLSRNLIKDEGAIALAEALNGNTSLHVLHLNHNKIGAKGAIALAGVLNETKLDILHLCSNAIGDEGAIALAGALKQNKFLEYLTLRENNIGVSGLRAILKALETNFSLKSIGLKSFPKDEVYNDIHRQITEKVKLNEKIALDVVKYIKQLNADDLVKASLISIDQEKLEFFLKVDKNLWKKLLQQGENSVSKEAADKIVDNISTYIETLKKHPDETDLPRELSYSSSSMESSSASSSSSTMASSSSSSSSTMASSSSSSTSNLGNSESCFTSGSASSTASTDSSSELAGAGAPDAEPPA